MKTKDQILLEQAYSHVIIKENEGAVSQEQLSQLFPKGKKLQFIKNTPVALVPFADLQKIATPEQIQKINQHAGTVDKTSYDEAFKSKGYVVFQMKDKENLDLYIANPSVVAQKYTKFEGSLPQDEKAKLKVPSFMALSKLGIDASKVPFYVKKVPTIMISAKEVGLEDKVIQTNWGTQHVSKGGFLVQEDNGHVYTVAPDQSGLPIGYISAIGESLLRESAEDISSLLSTLKNEINKEKITKILQDNPEWIEGLKKFKEEDTKNYLSSLGNFESNSVSNHLIQKMAQGKFIGYYDFM